MAQALITGGTSGIGAGYAQAFAKKGYDLVLVDKNFSPEKEFFINQLQKKYTIRVKKLRADLSQSTQQKKVCSFITKQKNIEVLINCAGFGLGQSFEDAQEHKELEMIALHCQAPLSLMRAVLDQMHKNKKGIIINVSSLGGLLPLKNNSVYGATKAFLRMLTESVALELHKTPIKLQVLAPGFVHTSFHDHIAQKQLKKHFFIRWMSVDQVITKSSRCLRSSKTLCIPGRRYRFLFWLSKHIPSRMYYAITKKL